MFDRLLARIHHINHAPLFTPAVMYLYFGLTAICYFVYLFFSFPDGLTWIDLFLLPGLLLTLFLPNLPSIVRFLLFSVLLGNLTKSIMNVHAVGNPVVDRFVLSAEQALFGTPIPTIRLQTGLGELGLNAWLDLALALLYSLLMFFPFAATLYFVLKAPFPFVRRYLAALTIIFLLANMTYLLFPATPPWLASQSQTIGPVTRIGVEVYDGLLIEPLAHMSSSKEANPVAAFPSMHMGYTVLGLWYFGLLHRRWGRVVAVLLGLITLLCIVYLGEHYMIDAVGGITYAILAAALAELWMRTRWMRSENSH